VRGANSLLGELRVGLPISRFSGGDLQSLDEISESEDRGKWHFFLGEETAQILRIAQACDLLKAVIIVASFFHRERDA
jgi:hypothetical protein